MLTMLLDHAREHGSSAVLYKRYHINEYGRLDLAGVAHLLQEVRVYPPKALVSALRQGGPDSLSDSSRHHESVAVASWS